MNAAIVVMLGDNTYSCKISFYDMAQINIGNSKSGKSNL